MDTIAALSTTAIRRCSFGKHTAKRELW
jgi:hypothetical protein